MPDLRRRCWFDRAAFKSLLLEARRSHLRETGGALLGWVEGDDWVVREVLGPGPNAKHGVSSFEPDAAWQVREGHRIYDETGWTVRYLGEWHTHPRGSTRPSAQDLKTMRDIGRDPDFETPRPLSAIAARTLWPPWQAREWSVVMHVLVNRELVQMEIVLFDAEPRQR
jgi:integrative and conjugative element protein (TIGR02256 family)